MQEEMRRLGDDRWIDLVADMQVKVVSQYVDVNASARLKKHSGWQEVRDALLADGVTFMRAATSRYPELTDLAVQRKYNRAGPCTVDAGNEIIDVPLASMDSDQMDTSLRVLSLQTYKDQPLVLISASIT